MARGPAVRETTERRQKRRTGVEDGAQALAKNNGPAAETGLSRARVISKPSPAILSDQPKWVQDLFEAHFRGSRTRELRHKPSGPDKVVDGKTVTPNRMKMSREDYAIGWLVMFEEARKYPFLLRSPALKNSNIDARGASGRKTSDAESEGLPVLSEPGNS
jgi:hypothetical protein